jgi:hypothetical protein
MLADDVDNGKRSGRVICCDLTEEGTVSYSAKTSLNDQFLSDDGSF